MTVTTELVALFLTDVEGSSKLWQAHPSQMAEVLDRLDSIVFDVTSAYGGVLEKPRGEGDRHLSGSSWRLARSELLSHCNAS